ncbi:glycoside hydrolase family 2 TIM barrel-domain containing protein [Anaerocolumna sp. MB42-C2]|uniref:glycoside hydrolase family 2 TIM barrel-domain containing protein n=1 Tax=Anaerocolumna sp. MB42-C2 TaxID=3070997 RepID=UPI0027E18CC7|nr:glycoside hydrolase family 2 TIM barrel-domain containing protein [Anaerocolumna sp. MB42-C2]WMJ89181.1 glycoside hydrolase family 2 TIM barrel-domain containing protein [Anaerocolumna sp. MB42-C2]
MRYLLNDGWKFTKQDISTSPERINQEDIRWQEVDLPHDWLIYNTKDLYETGEGWYQKKLFIDDLDHKHYFLYFEGIYMDSTVYVGTRMVGEWKYGYSSFEFDITDYLVPGENEIKVRVVYQNLNTRWYSGAGIYRNVWLKVTEPAHFISDGIYITTSKETEGWRLEIEAELIDESGSYKKGVLKNTVLNKAGNTVAVCQEEILLSKEVARYPQVLRIDNPLLWNLHDPNMYVLKTELIIKGRAIDSVSQNFGFRTLRFTSNEGFYLNEKQIKLHGVCEHHDLGALGAAVNKAALRRKFMILREMGVNAIRTSHNMPAVELMDLADELGFLVVSEAFDMWERPKTEYDYARFFLTWCHKDVASWIRRDRNHPSIIMWSIGNEIYDTHASERGLEITRMLRDLVLKHDPKKNGQVTIASNYMKWENAQKCTEELPIAGYNYGEALYEEHHKKYPHWIIYGSETAATIQSRGIYHFPAGNVLVTHEDEQCSSLGNCSTNWGAKNSQKNITDDRDAKFCLGQFIWTGFDYIGEPTPYFTKNSYFGQIDTAGFKKDAFFIYQAEWTDYKENPMVHLLPFWDFNKGQLIDIRVYSNAPKTELFFNDTSLGLFCIDHEKGKQLSGEWQIPYEPGIIKAVAYDENDRVIATDMQSSFEDAANIVLKPDKAALKADGLDMVFVEISMTDKNGVPVRNANNRVEVRVSGAGRLVGLDNGDSTDYDSYKGTSRRLFSGKLLAMIASKQEAGSITCQVSSPGMKTEVLRLDALHCEKIPGVSSITENKQSEDVIEIPIRKIELINQGNNHLTKERKETIVSARIFPENATYEEIEWKAMTVNGIISNVAKIEVKGREAIVTAMGDGEFRLCCTAKNGGKNPQVISELEFQITGLGEILINPYQFVSAGLYNYGNREFHSGLLGGVATDNALNYIGFKNVDFGEYGSDEITIPIYHLSHNSTQIEIWEGIPGEEDSQLLLDTEYDKDFIWNTYQAETYRLPKRLKGITAICIGIKDKLDIKGFNFTYYEKAFARLSAVEYNNIYGDCFTVTKEAIEKIGNNVAIDFKNMDFGDRGINKVVICGKSRTDRNTIHINFEGDESEERQSFEIPYSADYKEYEFRVNKVTGNQKVSFLFLPGSSFDFKWFQFYGEDK